MKVSKVVVVGPNFENLGVSFKVILPVFKGFDNGEEFFIINVVV